VRQIERRACQEKIILEMSFSFIFPVGHCRKLHAYLRGRGDFNLTIFFWEWGGEDGVQTKKHVLGEKLLRIRPFFKICGITDQDPIVKILCN
jgi:hypothetical protein